MGEGDRATPALATAADERVRTSDFGGGFGGGDGFRGGGVDFRGRMLPPQQRH